MQANGRSARRKFYLCPEHIMLLPPEQRAFWLDLSRVLRSRALQNTFKQKFCVTLEQRSGREVDQLSLYPVPILLRDLPGYRIGIQWRLARQGHHGALLPAARRGAGPSRNALQEDRTEPGAGRIQRLPFRPAPYAFPVVYHASWHSVVQTKATDGELDSLMRTY
jgi:hypothetical protein